MNTVEFGKYTVEMPSRFDELTEQQLYDFASARLQNLKLMDAQVILSAIWGGDVFKLNEKLIADTTKKLSRSNNKEELTEYLESLHFNRMHLANLCSWITQEHVCKKWIIEKIDFGTMGLSKVFLGPTHLFANIEFWEWCRIEQYWTEFQKSGSVSFRNRFLAALYHPEKDGERQAFEDAEVENYLHWFNYITPIQLEAISMNYVAIKAWLALQHPHVFKKRTADDGDKPTAQTNMREMLLRAAMEQHLDEEIVAKKPLLIELGKMEIKGKDAAEMRKQ